MERLIRQTLDKYQIIELLGEGGMGAVFKRSLPVFVDNEVRYIDT